MCTCQVLWPSAVHPLPGDVHLAGVHIPGDDEKFIAGLINGVVSTNLCASKRGKRCIGMQYWHTQGQAGFPEERKSAPGVHLASMVLAQKFSVSVQPGPLLGRIEHEPQPDCVVLPSMEHVPHSSRWVLPGLEHDPLIPFPWTAHCSETGL